MPRCVCAFMSMTVPKASTPQQAASLPFLPSSSPARLLMLCLLVGAECMGSHTGQAHIHRLELADHGLLAPSSAFCMCVLLLCPPSASAPMPCPPSHTPSYTQGVSLQCHEFGEVFGSVPPTPVCLSLQSERGPCMYVCITRTEHCLEGFCAGGTGR